MEWIIEHLSKIDIGNLIIYAAIFYLFYNRMEKKFDKIEQRLDRFETRLDRFEEKLDRFEIRLIELEKQMIEVKTILHMKECCILNKDYREKVE